MPSDEQELIPTGFLPPLSSFVPSSRNYGGQAGRVSLGMYPGLEPQAESFNPFGIAPRILKLLITESPITDYFPGHGSHFQARKPSGWSDEH
jgi:hypothetical protein